MSLSLRSTAPERKPKPAAACLSALVLFCCLCGFAGWTFWIALYGRELGQDFMVFHSAARAYFLGDRALIYDGVRITDYINENFTAWFRRPLGLHPYLYPPHFLLLLLPFGALPFGIAYPLFLLVTFAGLVAATRCYEFRGADQRRLLVLALLIFPQTPFILVAGQNSFLTASLLIAGFGLLDRNALIAGALLGLASYKPQFWLMVPIALLAARQWQALAGAAIAALLAVIASAAILGSDLWRDWIALITAPTEPIRIWLVDGRLNGQSVFACLTMLGASPRIANLGQAFAAALAAVAVYRCFRQGAPKDLAAAVLLAATLLAAPHVSSQDGIMLAVAAMFLLCRALDDGFRSGDLLLIACVWFVEAGDPPILFKLGVATPVVLAFFLIAVIARVEAMPRPAPLPRLA